MKNILALFGSRLMKGALITPVILALAALAVSARPGPFPPPIVPDGMGVNIHFTDPRPGEMEMLSAAGFHWIRMDFSWSDIEKTRGQYDFSDYDRLTKALDKFHIRAIYILDYANPLYDNNLSPHTDAGRQAFARWAAASAQHFKGHGILWEMYNEPNGGFWRPHRDVDAYIKLALAVGKALREKAPHETYIGPATSTIDFPFLEACFKAGLLRYWSAVSVHPYRQDGPETAAPEFQRLRLMIARYAPKGKSIPIISGEWGYSTSWGGMTDAKQGKMLPREYLSNLSNDVPVSIWYDWHDDGLDPKNAEHNFGTVLNPYHAGRNPVYDPKPSYLAARALSTALNGFRYSKRLAVGGADDYVLLFSKGKDDRLAAWTTSDQPHTITIPTSPGEFRATSYVGEALPSVQATAKGLTVTLTDGPVYLAPVRPNDLLRVAAAWDRLPLEVSLAAPGRLNLGLMITNPLSRPIRVTAENIRRTVPPQRSSGILGPTRQILTRGENTVPLRVVWNVQGMGPIAQETTVLITNPLRATILPLEGNRLPVQVENPDGGSFHGSARLQDITGIIPLAPSLVVNLGPDPSQATMLFALKAGTSSDYRVGAVILNRTGKMALDVPAAQFHRVDSFSRYAVGSSPSTYRILPDGDAKVASTQSIRIAAPPAGAPAPGMESLEISYRFDPGWKFVRLAPQSDDISVIRGQPRAFGLWIYGNGKGMDPRIRFTDRTGQTFQPGSDPITWKGWRYVEFPMNGQNSGHWGGANDGKIHYPIHWDSLFLLDNGSRDAVQGAVYISAPTLSW